MERSDDEEIGAAEFLETLTGEPRDEPQDEEEVAAANFLAVLMGVRQCVRCHREYRQIDNLGTHQCHYHPMTVNGYLPGRYPPGTYECCGRSRRDRRVPRGCQPCDHSATHGHEPTQRIDARHFEMLGLSANANRVLDPRTGDMIVYRFPVRRD